MVMALKKVFCDPLTTWGSWLILNRREGWASRVAQCLAVVRNSENCRGVGTIVSNHGAI